MVRNDEWKLRWSGIKSRKIICNMLQPNYYEDWIKGVYITYEGNAEEEQMGFDHVGIDFFGKINTKEKLEEATISIFKDTRGHWTQSEIEKFYGKDYVSGYDNQTFGPNDNITRGEFRQVKSI